jgi:hypothetical protein
VSEDLSFMDSTETNWRIYSKSKFLYDSKGFKTGESTEKLYSPSGLSSFVSIPERITYSYNPKGKISKMLYEQFYENAWREYKQILTSYNLIEDSLTSITLLEDGGAWYNAGKIISNLDAKGKVLVSLFQTAQAEEWKDNVLYTYTYDEKGNRIKHLLTPIEGAAYLEPYQCLYYYSVKNK